MLWKEPGDAADIACEYGYTVRYKLDNGDWTKWSKPYYVDENGLKNMSDYISNLGEDDVVNYIRTTDIGFQLNSKGEKIGYQFTQDRVYGLSYNKRQATGNIYYQRVNAPDKFTLSELNIDVLNGTWYLDAYALSSDGKKFLNKTTKWETVL